MLNYTTLGNKVYLAKEDSDRVNCLNSLIIEDPTPKEAILIEANYPFDEIDELYKRIAPPAKALLLSHGHTDHTAHAFYHQQNYETPIFIPVQEQEHLLSLDTLRDAAGFTQLGLEEKYNLMVREYMKFQECETVLPYTPGEKIFHYTVVNIETIHIPGHSPGHTAFALKFSPELNNKNILYVSDIGSHPYYGDLYCSLSAYRDSIDKLENIYLSGDYILVPAHGKYYLEKDPDFFNRIRRKIHKNAQKVLEALSKTEPKSIKDLVYEWFMTPKDRAHPLIKELYLLWDGGMIAQHLREFQDQGLVRKIEEKDFLNDNYILV